MIYSNYLSPIDNYSDLPFRLLCQKYGADATCVPLVNSTAIIRDIKNISRVDAHRDEKNLGVQLVGEVPEDMSKAAEIILEKFPFVKWLNVNAGCPSIRTVQCGGGSALLGKPDGLKSIVEQMKKRINGKVTFSIKIRIKKDAQETIRIARMVEKAGADFIIIHGRTAIQGYSGAADWGIIKKVKEALEIPLIGNGDIQSLRQGNELVANGYCDSFMVARAAMGNPAMFSGMEPTGEEGRIALLKEYIELHQRYLGEPELKSVKLKALSIMKGIPNATKRRDEIARAKNKEDIINQISRNSESSATA